MPSALNFLPTRVALPVFGSTGFKFEMWIEASCFTIPPCGFFAFGFVLLDTMTVQVGQKDVVLQLPVVQVADVEHADGVVGIAVHNDGRFTGGFGSGYVYTYLSSRFLSAVGRKMHLLREVTRQFRWQGKTGTYMRCGGLLMTESRESLREALPEVTEWLRRYACLQRM